MRREAGALILSCRLFDSQDEISIMSIQPIVEEILPYSHTKIITKTVKYTVTVVLCLRFLYCSWDGNPFYFRFLASLFSIRGKL
jgi:hypothetical protein